MINSAHYNSKSNKSLSFFTSREFLCILISLAAVALAHVFFWIITGKDYSSGAYNSFVYQSQSWLSGRLDVDNRTWLELAVYEGKYYVSFPPFPSVLILPLLFIFGESADAALAIISITVGVIFSVKLMHKLGIRDYNSVLLTVLLYLGTNMWQISVDSWVWFIAQNLSFSLSILAVYCACSGFKGSSMLFLACAVGCRPFQICMLPLCLYLLLKNDISEGNLLSKCIRLIFRKIYVYAPALLVVIFYLWLNYARFGNILEFGHNYLPEFVSSAEGQFSLSYAAENFFSLFRLPELRSGEIVFSMFNGNNIFIVIPIFAAYPAVLCIEYIKEGKIKDAAIHILSSVLIITQIFLLICHKTMGGAHFGHRYIMDTVPLLYFAFASAYQSLRKQCGRRGRTALAVSLIVITILGLFINFFGTAEFYGTDLPLIALQ